MPNSPVTVTRLEAGLFRFTLLVAAVALLALAALAGRALASGLPLLSKAEDQRSARATFNFRCDQISRTSVEEWKQGECGRDTALTLQGRNNDDTYELAKAGNELAQEAIVYGVLALCTPMLLLLIFYGLRWSVTGRMRPVWPISHSAIHESNIADAK